jgi:hypothetical protein
LRSGVRREVRREGEVVEEVLFDYSVVVISIVFVHWDWREIASPVQSKIVVEVDEVGKVDL